MTHSFYRHLGALAFFLSLSIYVFGQTQACDCVDAGLCPIPINDNSTTEVPLIVDLPGNKDLAECPLEQVCFTITHSWIGDLSVSLTSPDGQHYLIMADDDNNFGGCGDPNDNIDVCIVLGDDNPLTDNSNYPSGAAGPCPAGTCYLTGNWTVPCGGVNSPFTGALQAPGCDLAAFNQAGMPVNGVWVLTVMDVCNMDTGVLDNFSLTFGCDTPPGQGCGADGGILPGEETELCFGNTDLNMDLIPQFCGNSAPDPAAFGYVYLLVENDTIQFILPDADFTGQAPGTYQVFGFSYELSASTLNQELLGQPLEASMQNFTAGQASFCGDFSGNFLTVNIFGDADNISCSSITVDAGPDVEMPCDGPLTLFGSSSDTTASPCIQHLWETPFGLLLNDGASDSIIIGQPGVYIYSFVHAFTGCIVSDTVEILQPSFPIANAGQDTILPCWSPGYLLDGSASTVGTSPVFTWQNQDGEIIGNQATVEITKTGTYILEVFDSVTGCNSTDQVEVEIPVNIIAEIVTSEATCDQADGSATVILTTGSSATEFKWSNGSIGQTVDGLAQGWYSVTVTDDNCTYHQNFYLDENLSCKVVISGHVFDDHETQDCLPDSTSVGVACIMLHLLPEDIYTYSQPGGSYEFVVDAGTHTIEYIDEDQYELLCPGTGSITVNLPDDGSISEGNDFWTKKEIGQNLCVNMCFGPARPGFLQSSHFRYCNLGTEPADAVITLVHDPLLEDYDLSVVADEYDPSTFTATWYFSQIPPGECATIHYKLQLPEDVLIGTPLSGIISIDPIDIDPVPENNVDNWTLLVTGSFDPNEKSSLTGENQWGGEIARSDSIISYQILFQNTGTDTAFTVLIRDTLDGNLDVETIRPGMASHDYILEFEGHNILGFHFKDIMLPDSNVNETLSHGYVTFTIHTKKDLPIGTELDNRAAIFFDYNAPVITNTVNHVLTETVSAIKEEKPAPEPIQIVPNPNKGDFHAVIYPPYNGQYKLRVFDVTGRLAYARSIYLSKNKNATIVPLNIDNLPDGVYWLEIQMGEEKMVGRFVKQE